MKEMIIRQRLACPDGQFEKIPTKFNETLLNRQKQEDHCGIHLLLILKPEGYIEVTNKGKSNLEKGKYC